MTNTRITDPEILEQRLVSDSFFYSFASKNIYNLLLGFSLFMHAFSPFILY